MIKMDQEQQQRLLSRVKSAGIVLGLGIAYALFVWSTGIGIPCVFHLITGLQCPGCGISRMFFALLALDFAGAFQQNMLVFCLLPFALVLYLYKTWRFVKSGDAEMLPVEKIFYSLAAVLALVFAIVRNII